MAAEPVVVGGTYNWKLTATKDGAAYDLTGATVVLTFVSPSGTRTQYTFTAAASSPAYENPTGLITTHGEWIRSWKTTLSGVVLETREIPFTAYRSRAAA